MSLGSWIASNPEAATLIVSTVVGYVWNKARGKKQDDLWDTAVGLGRQVLPAIIKEGRLYDDEYVLRRINGAIWAGLDRLGVKHSKMLDSLVAEVAEHVKAELAERLFNAHLSDFIKVQNQTAGMLETALPEARVVSMGEKTAGAGTP